jgi:D-amino-acid dehydrogenase
MAKKPSFVILSIWSNYWTMINSTLFPSRPTKTDVLVIGGGVIGVCAAYYLSTQGRQVTLVEQSEVGMGCSYGNAGLIVPSHSIPLAAPGVLLQGLKWMLNPESPFFIKPRFDLDLFAWLWRFRATCNELAMRRAIPLLRDLNRASLDLYHGLMAQENLDCDFQQNGMLMLFDSEHGYHDGLAEAQLLADYGLRLKTLNAEETRALEPTAGSDVVGGVFFEEDAQLDPALFIPRLAECVRQYGGTIQTQTEVLGFEASEGRITAVKTSGGDLQADQVILATGAWSAGVVRDLRLKLPVQAAKGYSLTYRRPKRCPRLPLILSEARVAVTPLKSILRFAGTLELAGFDLSLNWRRVEAIQRAAADYLVETDRLERVETWSGLRPATPDGLPLIGHPPGLENLIIATGHAMLGVSLGPITGQLVAQLACDLPLTLDLAPFRLERFGG